MSEVIFISSSEQTARWNVNITVKGIGFKINYRSTSPIYNLAH